MTKVVEWITIHKSNDKWLTNEMKEYLNYIFKPIRHKDWPTYILMIYGCDDNDWAILSTVHEYGKLDFVCKHRFLFHIKSMRILYCCVFNYYQSQGKHNRDSGIILSSSNYGEINITNNDGIKKTYTFPLPPSDYNFISSTLSSFISITPLISLIISYMSYLLPGTTQETSIKDATLPPESNYAAKIRMKINKRIERLEQDEKDKFICFNYNNSKHM